MHKTSAAVQNRRCLPPSVKIFSVLSLNIMSLSQPLPMFQGFGVDTGFNGFPQGYTFQQAVQEAQGTDANIVYPNFIGVYNQSGKQEAGSVLRMPSAVVFIKGKHGTRVDVIVPYTHFDGSVRYEIITGIGRNFTSSRAPGAPLVDATFAGEVDRGHAPAPEILRFHMNGQPFTGSRLVTNLVPYGQFANKGNKAQQGQDLIDACDAVADDLMESYNKRGLTALAKERNIPTSGLLKSQLCVLLAPQFVAEGLLQQGQQSRGW